MKNNEIQGGLHKSVINWYPGHMLKAQHEIKENLKLIDIVIEILDARVPFSSSNPLLQELIKDKQKLIVLNKKDLADSTITEKFLDYFEKQGIKCIAVNTQIASDIKKIIDMIYMLGKQINYENSKVKINPIYRVLVMGIPNVGKSTIINKISGKNRLEVGNKPGVTKRKQWIRVAGNIDLLDTPGILWPNLSDENIGVKLALTGNINLDVLEIEELACKGIEYLIHIPRYTKYLMEKYKLTEEDMQLEYYDILEKIGRKRGCLISGGNVDMEKAARIFVDDFKNGKIGNISLDEVKGNE